jgi:riboflavin synthase
LDIAEQGPDVRLDISLPGEFARYAAFKGSIAVNGTSLTIASLGPDRFTVWVIPHTLENTNLGDLEVGEAVNLEFDILAKYAERLLATRPADKP